MHVQYQHTTKEVSSVCLKCLVRNWTKFCDR